MEKKEMVAYIVLLVLVAIIMLLFFYNSIKLIGSILLALLFLSLILRTIFAHKKHIKDKKKQDKAVITKKFYITILLVSSLLTIVFNNPNYSYSSLAIGILSLIFLFITELLTKQRTKAKYYLFFYVFIITAFKINFEGALALDKTLYYASTSTLGTLTLLFIYLTLKHDFKPINEAKEENDNETDLAIEPIKQDFQKLTDVDHLYEALLNEKSIKVSKVARSFSVPREKAEEWCRILEEGGLAILHYPAIGEPELRWKSIK